jgi:hypothetical protein
VRPLDLASEYIIGFHLIMDKREKLRLQKKKHGEKTYRTATGRARVLIHNAKNRAKNKKILCTLTPEDIVPLLERGVCEVTGLEFYMGAGEGSHPMSPSIDRINPNHGYIPSNIKLVVTIYNVAKNVWGDEVLLEFARHLVNMSNGPTLSLQNRTASSSPHSKTSFRA